MKFLKNKVWLLLICLIGLMVVSGRMFRFFKKSSIYHKPLVQTQQIIPDVTKKCSTTDVSNQDYLQLAADCTEDELDTLILKYQDCIACYLAKAQRAGPCAGIVAMNEAIDLFPKDKRLHARRAELRIENFSGNKRNLREAINDYSKVIEIDPEDTSSHLNRCQAQVLLNDSGANIQSAVRDCEYVINHTSITATAYFFRGIANMHLGNYLKSLEDFSEAARLAPGAKYPDYEGKVYPISYYRGHANLQQGKALEAENEFLSAIKEADIGTIWADLAIINLRIKNRDKAKQYIEKTSKEALADNILYHGLWASYYWVFNRDLNTTFHHIQKSVEDGGGYTALVSNEDRFKEFLSEFYQTPGYLLMRSSWEEDARNRRTDFNVTTGPYVITGACKKINTSSQNVAGEGENYFDFETYKPEHSIRSKIMACPSEYMGQWVDFSMKDADGGTGIAADDRWFWSVEDINDLYPLRCGILENPGTTNHLAIINYKMDAKQTKKEIRSSYLLTMVLIDEKYRPRKTLAQYISNESYHDIRRYVDVMNICDFDTDGLAEVILIDSRYAGYGYLVQKFATDFSGINIEPVEGFRGD